MDQQSHEKENFNPNLLSNESQATSNLNQKKDQNLSENNSPQIIEESQPPWEHYLNEQFLFENSANCKTEEKENFDKWLETLHTESMGNNLEK